MFSPQPSQEYLLECLDLDAETGLLTWRERPLHHFKNEHHYLVWKGRWSGVPAFREPDKDGYLIGRLDGRRRKAHRLIWKMVHGTEPQEIDHIDGDRTDNRPGNLRSVSKAVNARNRALQSNNTSGCVGVLWTKDRWEARIKLNGRTTCLGRFHNFEDAVKARRQGEQDLGFHPNHGRAA